MDGCGDGWPVDGTLPHLTAPVHVRLSPVHTFRSPGRQNEKLSQDNVTKSNSDLQRNDGDTVELVKPPLQSSTSYSGISLNTQLSDVFNLPWESAEAMPNGSLAALPSVLNVEATGDDSSEEFTAEPLAYEDDNASWPSDILSSDSQSAQDNQSHNTHNQTILKHNEASLADELLFLTPTTEENKESCFAKKTAVVAPAIQPFSEFTMQATESAEQHSQDFPIHDNYDSQVIESTCISTSTNTCPSTSSLGCNPMKIGQTIPVQSGFLLTPQHSYPTSDYTLLPDQTSQDFSSNEADMSDQNIGKAEAEKRIDDDFSLDCDPQSFNELDDCVIESPDLTADLPGETDNAQKCCTDPSSILDREHRSGVETATNHNPVSPVSQKESLQETARQPRELLFVTQNVFDNSFRKTELDSEVIAETCDDSVHESALLESDSNDGSERVPEDIQNDLGLDEQDACSVQNSSSSALMTSVDDQPAEEVSENSGNCEVEQKSALMSKTLDNSVTENALAQSDSNDKTEIVAKDIWIDLGMEEQDPCIVQYSGSSNLVPSQSAHVDMEHLGESDGSVSSGESVLLISDIEHSIDFSIDDEKQDIPIKVKTKNPSLPKGTCHNENLQRADPYFTTCDQGEQDDPDAGNEDGNEVEGSLENGNVYQHEVSSVEEHMRSETLVDGKRYIIKSPEETDKNGTGDGSKDSCREDVTEVGVESASASSKEGKEMCREIEMAEMDADPDVEQTQEELEDTNCKEEVCSLGREALEVSSLGGEVLEEEPETERELMKRGKMGCTDGDGVRCSDKDETKTVPEGSRVECQAGILEKDCTTSDAEDKDDTDTDDVAKHQDGIGDVNMQGTAARNLDDAKSVMESDGDDEKKDQDQAINSPTAATSDDTYCNQDAGVSQGNEEPIILSDSDEEPRPSPHLLDKMMDTNLPADDDSILEAYAKLCDRSSIEKEMTSRNLKSQIPEKDICEDNYDDDVLIIDEDPEIICLGSSDEDEVTDKPISKSKQLRMAIRSRISSASNKNLLSSVTARKQPVKITQWACHMCGEPNKSLNSLKLHVRRAHNLIMVHQKEDMKCKLCSFTGTWQKIKEHIIKNHETPLKWYMKNHEQSREITKLPLSASSVTQGKDATDKQSNHSDRTITPSTSTTGVRQHYVIKKVSNIDTQNQTSTKMMATSVRSPPSVSSLGSTLSSSATVQPGQLHSISKTGLLTRVSMPASVNQQVPICLAPTIPNSSVKKSFVIIRNPALSAVTKTTSGKSSVLNQSSLGKTQVIFNRPVVPCAMQIQQSVVTDTRTPVADTVATYITSPTNQTGVQQKVVQLSTTVAQPINQPIVYRTNTGQQYRLMTSPTVPQQQIVSVLGGLGISGSSGVMRQPCMLVHSKSSVQVTPNIASVSGISQRNIQKPAQRVLRVVPGHSVLGPASKQPFQMSDAKALLNAICNSSNTVGTTKVAQPPKTVPTCTVPALDKHNYFRVATTTATGNKSKLYGSGLSSPLNSVTSTCVINVPSNESVQTMHAVANSPQPVIPATQSSASSAATWKAETVTTQSSGPVTSSEISQKITVRHTSSDGASMASYLIKVPRSLTDSSVRPSASGEKEAEDYRSFLVKVPVNQTNTPKKFMVHLPVDKDSTVKHAVCIVQPPAAESDGTGKGTSVLGKISNSISSLDATGIPQSQCGGLKSSFICKTTESKLPSIFPLSITKARDDQSKKAECLAHLQEPTVDIKQLESQFKDTRVFKAADLIKVDDRVQYECARCKEAFPQLMLLQLHHIDCCTHPPSHKVLPIVHIPTALLAAFFTISASGYSSVCAICKILVLGNARNVEDQQDFASHLAKHTKPQVAITCLDDTRKLGILQTRMTSQQAKEWVDYIVPPFKMLNKPTSTSDGSLEEYVCTERLLHRESLIRKKCKRSLSPLIEKHKMHKKHKKHKHKFHDITYIKDTSKEDAHKQRKREPYQSSLRTAEGCEGEWIEPSPKNSGKLWMRKKTRPGGLKESIMGSPTRPKLIAQRMQVNVSKHGKHNKASPSKVSQRFMTAKIPGRRSLRGLGLDFGQGLMMLPMQTRKRKKMQKDGVEERVTRIATKKMNVEDVTPSCSTVVSDEDVVMLSCDKSEKKSNMMVNRQIKHTSSVQVSNSVKAQQANFNARGGLNTKNHIDDIIIILSSDDDDDIKNDGIRSDVRTETDGKTKDSGKYLEAADISFDVGKTDVIDGSDSKDADFSDNPDFDDSSSSDDEYADEHQSDMDELEGEVDEDGDGTNQRDIPLTMMALHYQRLNEEIAKSDQEEQESEDEAKISGSSIRNLSENKLRDGSEAQTTSQTNGDHSTVKASDTVGNYTNTKEIDTYASESNLQENDNSNQLQMTSPSPLQDDDSRSSVDYLSERSNSNLFPLESNGESSDKLSMECKDANASAPQLSKISDFLLSKSTDSNSKWGIRFNDDLQPSQARTDTGSEPTDPSSDSMLEGSDGQTSSLGEVLPDEILKESDNIISEGSHHESCICTTQENIILEDSSSKDGTLKDPTSDIRNLEDQNMEDRNLEDPKDKDEILAEDSSCSEDSSQERGSSHFLDNCILEKNNSEDVILKHCAPRVRILEERKLEDKHLEDDNEDDEILDFTQDDNTLEDSPLGDSILEGDATEGINLKGYTLQDSKQEDSILEDSQGDIAAIADNCGASIPEDDSSRDSILEDVTSKRKGLKDEIMKENTIKDSIQEEENFHDRISGDSVSETGNPKENTPKSNSKENSLKNILPFECITEDFLLEVTSGDENNQGDDLPLEKSSFCSCPSDNLAESNVQRDRFFREKNVFFQDSADSSQSGQTAEAGTSEEDNSDLNQTSRRDRFFSERSINLENSLDSHKNNQTPQDGLSEEESALDEDTQEVYRDDDSNNRFSRKVSDGEDDDDEEMEGEETAFQDDEDDDIIYIIDDSDEEDDESLLSAGDKLQLGKHTTFKNTSGQATSSSCATKSSSKVVKLEDCAEKQVSKCKNLKRRSSTNYEEEEEEDEDYNFKRSRGEEDLAGDSPSDSWQFIGHF